ncbi:hypothetical protein EV652_12162 [Kribbella steppae]|uniref:Uncharacterized protein n=1 Tax=Kribbella steppae TaxID=2512223 RepID=A0A4R2GWY0_9ACTN|nr:hypothetical protein EV652_12162 [Kribbella steppae]
MSLARLAAYVWSSVETGQDCSAHRQTRLSHRTSTGRPKHGASCSRTTRRPCPTATTAHEAQPARAWNRAGTLLYSVRGANGWGNRVRGDEAMVARGTRPTEPFPGTGKPWRCRCLTCRLVSRPRYNDVVKNGTGACNRRCRSRKIAEARRLDAAEAVATMVHWGWEPLEDYRGAGKPWTCMCGECGAIKKKKLAHLKRGYGGCTSCSGRDITPDAARSLMIAEDFVPQVAYPGSLQPWLSRCKRCDHLGSPTYAKVRRRGHQCWLCRSDKISQALQLDPIEAVARMRECCLIPVVPYPGNIDFSRKSRCAACETVLDPGLRLHNLRGGQGGCAVCAKRGINPTLPGYLYVVIHEQHQALKWGIANLEYRVAQHRSEGWLLLARWNFHLAGDAWEAERQIKAWVRRKGIPQSPRRSRHEGRRPHGDRTHHRHQRTEPTPVRRRPDPPRSGPTHQPGARTRSSPGRGPEVVRPAWVKPRDEAPTRASAGARPRHGRRNGAGHARR